MPAHPELVVRATPEELMATAADDFAAASESLGEVLELDPDNAAATSLRDIVCSN